MGDKIVVGPINKGFNNSRTAFVIDNDSFPTLINAYQWRGRVKRKRGTSLLGRLERAINNAAIATDGAGNFTGNILTLAGAETNASVVFNSITIGLDIFTDTSPPTGVLTGSTGGTGTINYASGALTIAGGPAATTIRFRYYPELPVMGLEDLVLGINDYPGTLAFDTKYSYNILTVFPYSIYNVSFYKNPVANGTTLPAYVPKGTWTPITWNGQDYQQFWTINYQGALWATNGITVPFTVTNIGMQFKSITAVAIITAGNGTTIPAVAQITLGGSATTLVIGDFVFINEVLGITGINFQTGYVTAIAGNVITVTFPFATLGGAYTSGGITQYLTNRQDPLLDGIRWYDGDPTDGNATLPGFAQGKGWVNFAPPLSREVFSIADLPPLQYYLVGAKLMVNFKDRLLFFGPVVQASSGLPIYLRDTVVYSQNGTPYYTASFTGDPSLATTVFHEILVPVNQTATANAWWEDQTGFGGFVSAGIDQSINTVGANEDVLIVGFDRLQTKLIYTGNDIVPFNFFSINSELGSSSTFSVIDLDKGVMTRGSRGFVITSQTDVARFDLPIPDEVFEMRMIDNGAERITAFRDFISEWCYFTYPVDQSINQITYRFPTQTLQYNYRDDSWAIFKETYTHYGFFRKRTGFTWATVGTIYPSWFVWNDPWNAGVSTLLTPEVIAGNQQGFVITRDDGTDEAESLAIKSISGSTITVPDHSLHEGDYFVIKGAIGTIAGQVNGKIFSVNFPIAADTFVLNPTIGSGTYLGGGVIQRMYVPFIQTKQFPAAWAMARKTRLGPQQYLFTRTPNGQIQLLIFLSQNDDGPYNMDPIVPSVSAPNNSCIYSTTLFTCPESTNLGLTPANINLNMVTALQQQQIWHRINTSLLGDTIQIGFTLSDAQMRSLDVAGVAFAITGVTAANPAVLTTTGAFSAGTLVRITGVVGMVQLNNNVYSVTTSNATTTTIGVDSSLFDAYVSGGVVIQVAPINQFEEIELHGFVLDVTPSMVLS